MDKELKYTQEDLDSITEKVRKTNEDKISKNYISKTEYEVLQAEYNNLKHSQKKLEIKKHFMRNEGQDSTFEDFFKLEKDNLENLKEEKQFDKYFSKLKIDKPYLFGETKKEGSEQTFGNEEEIMSEIFGNSKKRSDLIDGTIYEDHSAFFKKVLDDIHNKK